MDEVRSKDRSIIELQTQLKKISESEHKSLLKEEVSRSLVTNTKGRLHIFTNDLKDFKDVQVDICCKQKISILL